MCIGFSQDLQERGDSTQFHASFLLTFKSSRSWRVTIKYMKTEECPNCHRKLKVKEIIDEYSVIEECKHCNKEFKITYDEETFPYNLKNECPQVANQ